MKNHKEKAIIGCLLGTAIGDAMGLSYEGLSKQRLIKLYPNLTQYHFIVGKGMVSDDTEHTCLVAGALLSSGGDVETFKTRLAWKFRFWLLGLPAGIGLATLKAILKLWLGFSPTNSGVFSAGNGPAMRSAIIGVSYGHDREKLTQLIKANTRLTHTDPKAEFGALAVALAAYLASFNQSIAPQAYLENIQDLLPAIAANELIDLLKKTIDSVLAGQSTADFADQILGLKKGVTGYTYHTVPVAIHAWLNNQNDYQTAIIEIIRCGGDTDTVAAIAGGIIGTHVGKAGIPEAWLDNLWEFPRSIKWMEKLGQRLAQVDYHNHQPSWSPIYFIVLLSRNFIFMIIVLGHGFRRLLPPY
jgi:ADP-ribosyl-[dinitrogen reductase] hydrolase